MKKFEPISTEERKIIEEGIVAAIIEQFQKDEIEDEYYRYDVFLQNIRFRTQMSHKQLARAAAYTVDIMEELKNINNNGVNRNKLEEIKKSAENNINSKYGELRTLWQELEALRQISTKKLDELVEEIAEFRKVGGAYWMIMSKPFFLQALYAVYEVIVDRFDDTEERNWYDTSAMFLMRAIMRVRSVDIVNEESNL